MTPQRTRRYQKSTAYQISKCKFSVNRAILHKSPQRKNPNVTTLQEQ